MSPAIMSAAYASSALSPAPSAAVQAVLDQALQVAYSDCRRACDKVGLAVAAPLTLAQLRQGRLGQDLTRLALIAAGHAVEPQTRVLRAVESVLELLFWPAAAADYTVPPTFWATDLGLVLAQAKWRAVPAAERVAVGAAARRLGVSRPTVERWVDERALDAVRDADGRVFVLRAELATLLLAGGPPLASAA